MIDAPKENTKENTINNNKYLPLIVILISLLFFVFLTLITFFYFYVQANGRPDTTYFFRENFTNGIQSYKAIDAEWIQNGDDKGSLMLARHKFMAPHLSIPISTDKSPQESYVWGFRTKIHQFTDSSVVLGGLFFPTGELGIVMNEEGKIGIAHNLFDPPIYSTSPFGRLERDQWIDIRLLLDMHQKNVTAYVHGKKVLTTERKQDFYPLTEINLGAIWFNGAGNYGSPLDIRYDDVFLANMGEVPKPTFIDYIRTEMVGLP
ncbi:MAG TPA: hypothetical protein VJ824_01950 [Bacillota bacterium]|nr:hypothetical protein [Bacillota bacterium]